MLRVLRKLGGKGQPHIVSLFSSTGSNKQTPSYVLNFIPCLFDFILKILFTLHTSHSSLSLPSSYFVLLRDWVFQEELWLTMRLLYYWTPGIHLSPFSRAEVTRLASRQDLVPEYWGLVSDFLNMQRPPPGCWDSRDRVPCEASTQLK